MEELSLHILDIAENSIRAGAKNIEIHIEEDVKKDRLAITIRDDGAGMDEETQRQALDPFFTTKQSKRVGLGLPLLAAAAQRAGGDVAIHATAGEGTEIVATFQHSHIDRQPLGDMIETLKMLIVGNPDVEFRFVHRSRQGEKRLDTREMKRSLGGRAIHWTEGIRMIRKILEE